ncbi:MAG: peptidase domain-containing ABC transporter [Cyanomargarita calcarea GSE-NOS-MK-12-04C]|jgi:ATP-binding cassette subfamily B protein|uniref:Peptidase domain-containing ABC transporter n=1 Tax=Cyanomargarita calcarea GSE-NOS-MK-12-04C TaxID=2839659 RepID=A0A951UVT9_9CYAN|nr:peptidase domain-containing ABC transporter [Cyanomargarita calcarea GSE-NOS-MK-12-04C]
MSVATDYFADFIAKLEGFDQLSSEVVANLLKNVHPTRYRVGQRILGKEKIPDRIIIIYEGRVRLLAYDPRTQVPTTLRFLESGDVLGEIGILRSFGCEIAIASSEVTCLTLDATQYLQLLSKYPYFAKTRKNHCHLVEIFDVLSVQKEVQANAGVNLKEFAQNALSGAKVHYLPPGKTLLSQLDRKRVWFLSGGGTVKNVSPGTFIELLNDEEKLEVIGKNPARLIGLRESDLLLVDNNYEQHQVKDNHLEKLDSIEIPYASEEEPAQNSTIRDSKQRIKYPFFHGKGQLNSANACFEMVSKHLKMPFRKEIIQRILNENNKRSGTVSFQLCAYLAELLGLKAQLVDVSLTLNSITRIPTPALIRYEDSFAVLYEASEKVIVLGIPSEGIQRFKPKELLDQLEIEDSSSQPQLRVLLLTATKATPQKRFGLEWFVPYLSRYRRVLIEVFLASFFVQLAALANPLIVQRIIDQVIVQNSVNTLHIFGTLLLVVGFFEVVLTTLRTYLFVDTTNRIDMGLGSEIIDHLLRLPLSYYQRRPVGELSTRINELENIRKFMTGTALTVGLDALFSVIYVIVMLFYSWQLTLVGLATIPIFIILTVISSPIVRKQLRAKAERNAETQSYLVEVISGIQTVKAQNIELRTRFSWQERYANYVSTGFKTVIASTLANSTSNFLNKLSSLLVLWMGAYLVVQGELTLGELIAFRIISSYVTSPILRLAQLWQSFQETALSLERLSDIVDTPQEAEQDRNNIPLPAISGAVRYENIFFRFKSDGPLQLCNVNLDFKSGEFIGIVGQSGAGKSTLTKLLIRLYEHESGRIVIDGYDISKVELYSLRRQVGFVPQDTLLFEGTIQENIALTNPDATTEEILEAARIAAAHDFIMDLPNGYNTKVGERGGALSGGQRQRIALARSVLQRPKLLVLDEATSALDYVTERQVCLNLADSFKDSTVFFITHRLNTVKHADTIVVMDAGRVIEQGTHNELMSREGHYSYLYNQQEMKLES